MLSNKIRTAVAVLAAASSVAVATGPVAAIAQADKNIPGRFTRSSEGLKTTLSCDDLRNLFVGTNNAAQAADDRGDTKTAAALDQAADNVRDKAGKAGCSWVRVGSSGANQAEPLAALATQMR